MPFLFAVTGGDGAESWVNLLTLIFTVILLAMQRWNARNNQKLIQENRNETIANKQLIIDNTQKTEETCKQVNAVSNRVEETRRQVTAVEDAVTGPLVYAFRERAAALLKLAKMTGDQEDYDAAATAMAALEKRLQSIRDLSVAMKKLINRKVLLVEDDLDDSAIFSRDLASLGLEVTNVRTREEAVAALKKEPHGLCFLDLGLPDSVGPVELVDSIAAACPGMQIAIVSGGLHDSKLKELLRERVVAILPKPVTRQQLKAILDETPKLNGNGH